MIALTLGLGRVEEIVREHRDMSRENFRDLGDKVDGMDGRVQALEIKEAARTAAELVRAEAERRAEDMRREARQNARDARDDERTLEDRWGHRRPKPIHVAYIGLVGTIAVAILQHFS